MNPESGRVAGTCVLLACFPGAKQAAKLRRQLNEAIEQAGDAVLDQVVVKVSAKHKAQVHDPQRTLGGTLTPVLTWGVFGLLAGGLKEGVLWAVIGGICGGLYAYYFEHLLTKDELRRIGRALPAESSAIVAWLRAANPRRILASTDSFQPATASVAAVTPDLSAQVYSSADEQGETSGASGRTALSMVLMRFAGERGAREALANGGSKNSKQPQVELFIEANTDGRRRVVAPKTGSADFAKMDILGWGVFGVAWGLIVGIAAGDEGALGDIESGLLIGVLWGLFGAVAGALYGMWAGRGLSARRLKGLGAFVPPENSLVVAWAEGAVSQETTERWAPTGSQRLILRFDPVGDGAVLKV